MNLEKVVKYLVPVFVLAIVSRAIEEISFIYYAVPVLCVFFILLLISSKPNSLSRTGFGIKSQHKEKIQESDIQDPASGIKQFSNIIHQPFTIFLIPGAWFLITSFWSSYPEISSARALYFILISLGSISAGILWVRYSGKNVLEFLLPANIIVVLICLFSLVSDIPSDTWTGGHGKGFLGFFGHQNLLASVLLFTMPAVLHRIVILVKARHETPTSDSRRTSFAGMTEQSDSSFRRSPESEIPSNYLLLTLTAYSLLLIANILLLALTYSRSAILSVIFGVIVFVILNKRWKMLAYGLVMVAVLGVITYSIPSLNQFANKMINKDFPEVYSSRIWMWEPSYKAALEGGITGLGYGISHPDIRSGEYSDRFENGRLIREKGNSVLALLEEAGLIGLFLFLLPIIYTARKFIIYNLEFRMNVNQKNNYTFYIIHSSLAAMLLHAQFEAWWVGVGSIQLPIFYAYIGLIAGYTRLRFT